MSSINQDALTGSASQENYSNVQETPAHLVNSELPFFVVLTERKQGITRESPLSASSTQETSWTRYPEVKYVFEDDFFQPTIDVIEQNPGDVAVVIDFAPNGKDAVSYKSLSSSWQVVSVASQSSAAPSWVEQTEDSGTTMLCVTGTSPSNAPANLDPVAKAPSESSQSEEMTVVKALIEAFRSRNDQLKQVLESSTGA
jgi:hypothetical protein